MTFRRFIDIILRSMLLNAWLLALLSSLSLAMNGNIFFLNSPSMPNTLLISMLVIINILHWGIEIICLFIKLMPDGDLE